MIKLKKYLILFFLLLLLCQTLESKEQLLDDYSEISNPWEKAVIVEGHINALLPYSLDKQEKPAGSLRQLLMISITNSLLNDDDKCQQIPVRVDGFIDSTFKRFNIAFKYYSFNHPTAWDLSDDYNLYFNDLAQGSISEFYNYIHHHKKYEHPKDKSTEYMHSESYVVNYDQIFRKKYVEDVDEDGNLVVKNLPFEPEDGLNMSMISKNDGTVNLFMLNRNQVLVWQIDYNKGAEKDEKVWKFEYAFKMPMTTHFEVCSIGNNLYILTNEYGIYKLSISDAKRYAPEQPKDVLKKYSNHINLLWDGFLQEHIVKNEVKAEKISNLNYDRYIVDKDHNTAYVVSDGYLYELYNLKIRSKIPELSETENFVDKEAEYMRAVLEAIYKLGSKPEKTPEELLKVMPDSENDIMLAEKEVKNANNSGSDDDNDDSDNGEESVDNDDDTDTDNNSGSSENTNNDDSANANSALTNKDTDNDKINPVNSNKTNISDGINLFTYIGISAGAIILLTLIFLVLFRKRKI